MIREKISQLIQDVHDGNESACKAYALLKDLQVIIDAGLNVIQTAAMQEAREFNKNEVYYGGIWEYRNTPTYLDFSKDEVFVKLSESASKRKKKLNDAWKANKEGQGFFDKETGEEIPILPVKTPSKEILIFKPKA